MCYLKMEYTNAARCTGGIGIVTYQSRDEICLRRLIRKVIQDVNRMGISFVAY